jgi:hypothetical protein
MPSHLDDGVPSGHELRITDPCLTADGLRAKVVELFAGYHP